MADRLVSLPGLRTASWRGIRFAVYDLATPAGRRLQSIDLPGSDTTIHEDLGLANGPIRVSGVILGDDVVDQARALEAAFNEPGPGTLVHPWYGARQCILDDQGGEIVFKPNFLRGLTFQASFRRWTPTAGAAVSTLAAISSAASALTAAIAALVSVADEALGGDLGEELATAWDGALEAIETTAIGAGLTAIAKTVTTPTAIASADSATTWIASTMATLGAAGVPPASPAVGAGPLGRSSEATLDPLQTAIALRTVAVAVAEISGEADGEAIALARIAVALGALVAMVEPLAAVDWESRQQAMLARYQISAAISIVADQVIAAVDASADALRQRQDAWRALGALRRRIHEDLDDRIGRLPAVMTIRPPAQASAWILAQYVAGDDPKALRSTFEDIVSRNGLVHPSVVALDEVEVLPPAAGTAR